MEQNETAVDVTATQPTQAGGEGIPPQGAPSEPTPTPQPTQAPVTPAPAPAPAPEPVKAPAFAMPGSFSQPEDELAWLRQNYAQAMNTVAEMRGQLQDWELAGLDEQEKERALFERQKTEWQQQMDTWRNQQALGEWRTYFSQFPAASEAAQVMSTMTDPVQMTHTMMVDLATQVDALKKENAALKSAAGGQTPGPPVTTGGQGGQASRTLFQMSRQEREALMRKARLGLLTDADVPGA